MNYHPPLIKKRSPVSIPPAQLAHQERKLYRQQFLKSICCALILLCLCTTTVLAQSCPSYPSPHQRIGFNMTLDDGVTIGDYNAARLGAGWHHDYRFQLRPSHPGGIRYHQMVRSVGRTTPALIQQLLDSLAPVVDANPSAMWLLGNEPDRHGQDELTPEQYARFYHDVYTFLKQRDPTSRIAIAGIVQPTPIRLRYLDMVLAAYQQSYGTTMPVEYWDVHNFILPENCAWGAGIPPGLEAYRQEGIACPATLDDHGNIEIFQQQLRTFRQWMKERGYRDRPLIVSEYGILLSQYHGYPHPRVRGFMLATFNFMLNTKDSQTGYAADDNRLVQEFAWFSLNYYEFDLQTYIGLNGNLFDHDTRQITLLGLDYEKYVQTITIKNIDLAVRTVGVEATQPTLHIPMTWKATFANQGSVAAQDVVVRFWHGDPRDGGQLLGATATQPQALADCALSNTATLTWTPSQVGAYTIFAEIVAANSHLESTTTNNYKSFTFNVADLRRGDCNNDITVNAGDLTATAIEIFDKDGTFWLDALQGTFAGTPACDANADTRIDAGDLTCTARIIFNGANACKQN